MENNKTHCQLNRATGYELYYLTTPFCQVCQTAFPFAEIVAQSLEVPLLKVNVQEIQELVQLHRVSRVPALLLCYEGEVIGTALDIADVATMYHVLQKQLEQHRRNEKNLLK